MSVLKDKQYKEYNYFSRYTSFPYYFNTYDSKYIYGTPTQLKKDSSYVLHKIINNDTLDSLALDYYNNPTFFWVIADFNSIQDPYVKLKVGENIKIPSLTDISFGEN